jgi:hypothetical protein
MNTLRRVHMIVVMTNKETVQYGEYADRTILSSAIPANRRKRVISQFNINSLCAQMATTSVTDRIECDRGETLQE